MTYQCHHCEQYFKTRHIVPIMIEGQMTFLTEPAPKTTHNLTRTYCTEACMTKSYFLAGVDPEIIQRNIDFYKQEIAQKTIDDKFENAKQWQKKARHEEEK